MSENDTTIALEKSDSTNAEITDASLIERPITGVEVKRERIVVGSDDTGGSVMDLVAENQQNKIPAIDQSLSDLVRKLLAEQTETNNLLRRQLLRRPNVAGFRRVVDGASDTARISNDSSTIVQSSHEILCEATYREKIYSANTGTTGILIGNALTTTPPFTLYNPVGSRYSLNLIDIFLGLSAINAPPQGAIVLAFNPSVTGAAPVGGTSLVTNNHSLGGRPGIATAFSGATLNAIPTLLRPVANMHTANAYFNIYPWLSGSVIIKPGTSISLQAIAAGALSAMTLIFGAMWEEIYVGGG